MSDIQVTSVDGNQINVTTGVVVGPLPSLQLAAGTGITIASGGGVSTISANLSELSIPANLADLADVTANATAGQLLSYNGTSWAATTVSVPANLADLVDVTANATAGQLLSYNGTSWAATTVSVPANLADLADVTANATAGQALTWNGTSWEAANVPAGTTVNGLSGDVTLLAGSNINLSTDGQNITIGTVGAASIAAITDLTDVNSSMTPASGQALVWDGTEWTADAVTALVSDGTTLDLGTGKILYSNVYPTLADLPDAASYHGMFAHVHAEGAAYYAHAGNWVRLADDADVPTAFVSGLNGLTGSIILAGGNNVQIGQSGNQLTISSTQTFSTLNGESGSLSLVGGEGVSVSTVDGVITVSSPVTVTTRVNQLTGNVGIVAGNNINVTTTGQNVVITGEQGGIVWGTPPTNSSSPGSPGDIAYDNNYLYLRTSEAWRQVALSPLAQNITISQQPTSQAVEVGQDATFSVLATAGGETIAYQWQQSADNGSTFVDVANATSNSLTVTTNLSLDGYQYRASLSAPGAADVTTSVATLTVGDTFDLRTESGDRLLTEGGLEINHDGIYGNSITITQQPQNTTASGGAASFSVAATVSDGSNATYQWQEFSSGNWSDISGETAGTLNLTGLTLGDDGSQYRAVASAAGAANVTSDAATLAVPTVEFSQQPQNTTVVAGNDATFSATLAPADNWYVYDMKWERADSGSPNSWSVVETEDIAGYDVLNSSSVSQNYTRSSTSTFDDGDLFRSVASASKRDLRLSFGSPSNARLLAADTIKYDQFPLHSTLGFLAASSGTLRATYFSASTNSMANGSKFELLVNGTVVETFTVNQGGSQVGQDVSLSAGDQVEVRSVDDGINSNPPGLSLQFTPTAGLQTQNATSATATLTVNEDALFSQQPQNTTVVAGNDATFSATLTPADNWYVYDMKWERADSGSPNSWSVVETEDIANYDISNSSAVTQNYTWPSAGSSDDGDLFRATGGAFENALVQTSPTPTAIRTPQSGSVAWSFVSPGDVYWSATESGTLTVTYGKPTSSYLGEATLFINGAQAETAQYSYGWTGSSQQVSSGDQIRIAFTTFNSSETWEFTLQFTPTAGLQTQNVTSATATLTVT